MLFVHIMLFSESLCPFIRIDFGKEGVCLFGGVVDVGEAEAVGLGECLLIDRCSANDIDIPFAGGKCRFEGGEEVGTGEVLGLPLA